MPITRQPRTTDDQTTLLLAAFRQSGHLVTRIELQRKGEKGGYHAFMDLNIDHGPEGASPEPGDEQVKSVMETIRGDVDDNGSAQHKIIAFGPKPNGSEGQIFAMTLGELPPTSEDGRKSRESNAVVDVIGLMKGMLSDVHTQHIQLLQRTIEIPDTLRKVFESFPKNLEGNRAMYEYMIKSKEMDKEENSQVRDFEEQKFKIEKAIHAVELIMPYLIGDFGVKGTPGKPPVVGKCHAFYASLTPQEKELLIPVVGEDALKLFEAAGNASTDDEARAIIQRLEQVWEGKDPMKLIMQIAPIIGKERGAVLIAILKIAATT